MKRVLSWLLVAALCAATPAYAGTGNAGERFTFEFHAEPLVEVLTFISRKTHIDLVPDASLPANLVTQRMENKTLSRDPCSARQCVLPRVRSAEPTDDHRRK